MHQKEPSSQTPSYTANRLWYQPHGGGAECQRHGRAPKNIRQFLRQDYDIDVRFLTETHARSYYSFHSEGHLIVVHGTTKDKWAGATAVIAPHIIPYVKTIIQHTSRILQITLSARSGDIHFIGIYAPHDRTEVEQHKLPFWEKFSNILDQIPCPEPYCLLEDLYVRLRGRFQSESDFLGPHVYGKGHLHANTHPDSNRSLHASLLKSQGAVDALTFKQPNLLQHVTYKDKLASPKSWDQFIQDTLGWLQLWYKFQALPLGEDDQLQIVSDIRSFLDVDTLPSLHSSKPTIDPVRFQSLDGLVTLKKWLPTRQQVASKTNAGFPSDRSLVRAKISIKLGAHIKFLPRKPKLEYTADAATALVFNQAFQQSITALRGPLFKATPPSSPPDLPPLPIVESTLQVYTDGSGSKGRCNSSTPAGWGYVFVLSDVVIHEACGRPVTTQPSTARFLGATVRSNNTGELTAWMEAALHLLGNLDSLPSSVTFLYGNKWAANMVTGKFRAKRNRSLVANAKRIYALLQSKTQVHWQWVKGHSGAKHNEHADALAEKGKQTQDYMGGREEAEFFYTPATLPSESTPPVEAQGATSDTTSSTFRQAPLSAEEVTFKIQLAKNKMAEHDPTGETDYRIAKSQAWKPKETGCAPIWNKLTTPRTLHCGTRHAS